MFFEEISATLQLGTGPLLLPHTDMVTAQMRSCSVNSLIPKEKGLVASYRHELPIDDAQAKRVA